MITVGRPESGIGQKAASDNPARWSVRDRLVTMKMLRGEGSGVSPAGTFMTSERQLMSVFVLLDRHTLCQISRLIDVTAAPNGDVVREKLQRHDRDQRRQELVGRRHLDDVARLGGRGPIALIDEQMPVVTLAPADHVFEKMIGNMQEAKARGGSIIALTMRGDNKLASILDLKHDVILEVPRAPDLLVPIVMVLPLQLLAYAIAVRRGCDVDQPRNLAKSVTVE